MSTRTHASILPHIQDIIRASSIDEVAGTLQLNGQLSREDYAAVMKVMKEYGGKWVRGKGLHVFPAGAIARLLSAVEVGEYAREKVIRQSYYTPDEIADELVEFSGLGGAVLSGHPLVMLEPSCGGGSLIAAALRAGLGRVGRVVGCDTDAEAVAACKARFLGAPVTVHECDFLVMPPITFGYCLMNPPFARGACKAHVARACSLMRDGDVVAAIVPAGFDDIPAACYVERRMEVSAGAFKESGTMIATSMLRMLRR